MTVSEATPDALTDLVRLAESIGGKYSPAISLEYHIGVSNNRNWACFIEADIPNGNFGEWGSTPEEAVRLVAERVDELRRGVAEDHFEWYYRDGWTLAAVLHAGKGDEVVLSEIIGATRDVSHYPGRFIDPATLGWSLSCLVHNGLLTRTNSGYQPSDRARDILQRVREHSPSDHVSPMGLAVQISNELRANEPITMHVNDGIKITERDYASSLQEFLKTKLD